MTYETMLKIKELRELKIKLKQEAEIKKEQFMKENSELFDNLDAVDRNLSEKEQEARDFMIKHYERTGEKKHKLGLGVRVVTKLSYDDIQALNYCKHHDFALTFVKKQFETIAKNENLEFVTKEEVVSATIPTTITLGENEPLEE